MNENQTERLRKMVDELHNQMPGALIGATTCQMEIGEDGDCNAVWFCSACNTMHRGTAKFERSKICPACQATITDWVGEDAQADGGAA